MRITIGADPELFTKSRETGQFVSAHEMLTGTKAHPEPVNKGALQIDGTALEFNIDPAASCDEFVANITEVRRQLGVAVAGFNVDVVAEPVAEFDSEYFKSIPEYAKELGCNPDFNAWTLEQNPMPDAENTFRTGSGHVHIGWGSDFDCDSVEHLIACSTLVRQLDYYVGLPSLQWDPDNRRRKLYGAAGAMRAKPYGVEYRVLSNAWLRDEATMRFVYDATYKAVEDLMAGIDKGAEFGDMARQIIDNNEVDWALRHDFGTGMKYG